MLGRVKESKLAQVHEEIEDYALHHEEIVDYALHHEEIEDFTLHLLLRSLSLSTAFYFILELISLILSPLHVSDHLLVIN